MNKEEFLNHINAFKASEAKYQALSEKYDQQMPDALTAMVFEHFPALQSEKEKVEKIIYAIAEKYTDEIWEEFGLADWKNHSKQKTEFYKVPQPRTKDEEEQELLDDL
ncbi:MAG: hypothetical protein PF450_14785 [Bacteroidales bacterium]|jgi:hypothetical protein|nr:hypothetical protein [Bacteroidales bacterium]